MEIPSGLVPEQGAIQPPIPLYRVPFSVPDTTEEGTQNVEDVHINSTICGGVAGNLFEPDMPPPQEFGTDAASSTDSVEPEIFITGCIEIRPQYPGGHEAMLRFIDSALGFPALVAKMDSVKEEMEKVTVLAHFRIESDGRLTEIRFLRPAIEPYQTEVRRILEAMPKWIPGTRNKKPVPMYQALPINILLFEE